MSQPVYIVQQPQMVQTVPYQPVVPGAVGYAPYGYPSAQPIVQGQALPQLGHVISPSGPMQFVYVQDPLTELQNCIGALIRQQPEWLEVFTGCETQNRYHVFGKNPNGGLKYLFKCQERSSFCERNCCPASVREFNMEVRHIASYDQLMASSVVKNFANIFKPLKCPCFCLNRPEMDVQLFQTGEHVGIVRQPFSCCDPHFQIFDSGNVLKYYIIASCCQCAICCANSLCGKCSEGVFNIYPAEGQAGGPIGRIVKKSADFSELMTSADSYQVEFPATATPLDKLLIISLGLMIDYQYFEESASDKNSNRNTYYY